MKLPMQFPMKFPVKLTVATIGVLALLLAQDLVYQALHSLGERLGGSFCYRLNAGLAELVIGSSEWDRAMNEALNAYPRCFPDPES